MHGRTGWGRPNYSFHKNAHKWQGGPSRFRCIVDNQLLSKIINGAATCTQDDFLPTIESIINTLGTLMDNGLRPSRDTEEVVEWRSRDFNSISGHCCNHALNGGLHVVSGKRQRYFALNPCWEIHSDGACRNDGKSAIGFVIHAVTKPTSVLVPSVLVDPIVS